MVGDHQEVERPDQLHGLTGVRDHLLTAREAKAGVDVQRGSNQPRIKGKIGVEMGVTEKHAVGIAVNYAGYG